LRRYSHIAPHNNVFLVIRRKFTLDLIILAFPTKISNLNRNNFEKWQVTNAVFSKISETQVNDRLEKTPCWLLI